MNKKFIFLSIFLILILSLIAIGAVSMLGRLNETGGDTENEVYVQECSANEDCFDNNSCTIDSCHLGECLNAKVVLCYQNDKCCPEGCNPENDNDCLIAD